MDLSFLKDKKYARPLIIAAIVLVLDLVFVLGGQLSELGKMAPRINKLKQDFYAAQKNISARKNLQQEQESLSAGIIDKQHKIVSQKKIPLFLSKVSRIAQDAGVRLMQITPASLAKKTADDKQGGKYFKLPITLNLKCGYHNLGMFMEGLQGAKEYIRIADFDIRSVNDPPFKYPVKMTIEIVVRQ
ncbi:MAG: type 4a pilus biogenesis protein PilO [Candidatus Omnitrophota bacterium]